MLQVARDVFALAGPVLIFWAFYGYAKGVKDGEIRPHKYTWPLWAIATTAGWIATQRADGFTFALIVPTVDTIIEYYVVWLAWTGYGYVDKKGRSGKAWQKALTPVALLLGSGWYLAVHWHWIDLVWGVTAAIIGDILAAIFTLHKEIEDPASEDWRPWALSFVGATLVALSLPNYSYTAAGFTIYLAAMTGVIALVVYAAQQFDRKKRKGRRTA